MGDDKPPDPVEESARSLDAVVVTGTYGMAFSNMYVNLRMTRLQDGAVLGATDFQIARDLDVRRMTAESADARPAAGTQPQQMRHTP